MEFDTYDLKGSVGHIHINMDGTKLGENNWKIHVSMSEDYDFEQLIWPTSGLKIANDIAYIMERIGMIHIYHWDLDFEFDYINGEIK